MIDHLCHWLYDSTTNTFFVIFNPIMFFARPFCNFMQKGLAKNTQDEPDYTAQIF